MIEDIILKYADLGFAYLVSGFMLWKSYKQDKEYLTVLTGLKACMEAHVKQKDELIEMIKKDR